MRVLILSQTNHIKSGSGAVIHHLTNHFKSDQMMVLSAFDENGASKENVVGLPIVKMAKMPKRGKRFFFWMNWLILKWCKNDVLNQVKEFKPQIVVSVYPDEYFMLLGVKVAKSLGLPFVPWMHNTYAENRKGLDLIIAKYVQKVSWRYAALILTISDGLTNYYKNNYPNLNEKFKTLQHGFPTHHQKKEEKQRDENTALIKIAFTGSLNSSCIEASKRLFQVFGKEKDIEMHLFSGTPEKRFNSLMPDQASYIYHGFVSEESFSDYIRACDIVVIAHGFTGDLSEVEYETIFPTRTIPLLNIGVPILIHSPKDASFTHFAEKHSIGVVVSDRKPKSIMNAVRTILLGGDDIKFIVEKAFATAKYFDIKTTGNRFEDYIKELIK